MPIQCFNDALKVQQNSSATILLMFNKYDNANSVALRCTSEAWFVSSCSTCWSSHYMPVRWNASAKLR